MVKEKIETAFARLDRLGLEQDNVDVSDAQESMRRADLLMSVIRLLLNQHRTDTSLAPSTRSKISFEGYRFGSKLWVTRKTTGMFRLCLNSWMIFEMLPSVTRLVVAPNRFYGPLNLGNWSRRRVNKLYMIRISNLL